MMVVSQTFVCVVVSIFSRLVTDSEGDKVIVVHVLFFCKLFAVTVSLSLVAICDWSLEMAFVVSLSWSFDVNAFVTVVVSSPLVVGLHWKLK